MVAVIATFIVSTTIANSLRAIGDWSCRSCNINSCSFGRRFLGTLSGPGSPSGQSRVQVCKRESSLYQGDNNAEKHPQRRSMTTMEHDPPSAGSWGESSLYTAVCHA